jgi:DNA-binding NtrC family response regulator
VASGCLLYISAGTPEDLGRSLKLEHGAVVVGRDGDCDLILADKNVSRRHVRLTAGADGILVEDLGSTNGINYLGRRIERATLGPGARIVVAETCIDLLPLADAPTVPLSVEDRYGDLLGASAPMRRLFSVLTQLEQSDVPVLIEGETGTGKELVARALHEHGPRADKPFVIIDCGNVSPELMESEIFGHRQGAFTGALADRVGAFEQADGGTVFLDELGELPRELQPKLLRVLETGQIKAVGATTYESVDVRVIAAAKRQLAEEVDQGRFRDDLFYRVAVVQLRLPPLRERLEDIPMLVGHLASLASGGKVTRLAPATQEYLKRQEWPGNVRELRNVVQRTLALQLAGGRSLPGAGFPQDGHAPSVQPEADGESQPDPLFREARDQAILTFEQEYLSRLWAEGRGNLSAAARAAGIDRKYLRTLLRKHGFID